MSPILLRALMYDIQGLPGCDSLDAAVEILHRDMAKRMSYKFRYKLDYGGTPGEAFEDTVEKARVVMDVTGFRSEDVRLQFQILRGMGMN